MPIRSHVDPCLFIVFMHVSRSQVDGALEDALNSIEMKHGQSVHSILDRLQPRSKQVHFHEDYHFWQGLRLPFLFRYAFRSFFAVMETFREAATRDSRYEDWSFQLPEFERLNLKSTVGFAGGGRIYWGAENANLPKQVEQRILISPLDLLECAASLAEFQVMSSANDRVSPLALQRWSKRNPAYLEPFRFAANFLGSETLAIRAILALINAAFHTTLPERTFVELLARLWGNFVQKSEASRRFLAQQEPCRWPELFQIWLDEIKFEQDPDADLQILGGGYSRLTLDHWVFAQLTSGDGGFLVHPFLGPLARRWRREEVNRPSLSMVLDHPGWVDAETAGYCRSVFSPPFSVIRFHIGAGKDRVLWMGTGDLSGFTSIDQLTEKDYKGFAADFITMYSAIRRASGAHFDGDQRICYHTRCPQYGVNCCNAYPIVPLRYEDCGFPKRMERLVKDWRMDHGDDMD